MSLITEKHPDWAELVSYFKDLEEMAHELGIDTDELIEEACQQDVPVYVYFRNRIVHRGQYRSDLFRKHASGSIRELSVIVNSEKRA